MLAVIVSRRRRQPAHAEEMLEKIVDAIQLGDSVLANDEQAFIAGLDQKGVIGCFSQTFADSGGQFRQGSDRAQHDLPRRS